MRRGGTPQNVTRIICKYLFVVYAGEMGLEPGGAHPAGELHLDARTHVETLRALAHPLRMRLLGTLRREGPATASQLAAALGESSGLTSYHLRQLAEHGLVVDDPERGNGRERYWKSAHRTTHFDMNLDPALDPEGAGGEFLRSVARTDADRLIRFADTAESLSAEQGPEWAAAYDLSDWCLHLTLDEVVALRKSLHALIESRRRDHPTSDSRTVTVQFAILPQSRTEPQDRP